MSTSRSRKCWTTSLQSVHMGFDIRCTDGTSARRPASGLRRVFDIFLSYRSQPDYVAPGVGDGAGPKITVEVMMGQGSCFSLGCHSGFRLSLVRLYNLLVCSRRFHELWAGGVENGGAGRRHKEFTVLGKHKWLYICPRL